MSAQQQTVWFITGTSRGIGLEMTTQLLHSPHNVVLAACRTPSKADALQALTASAGGRLHVLRLDVTDTQSIQDAAREAAQILGEKGVDYLINNAGVNPGGMDHAFSFSLDNLTNALATNLVGPALVAQSLLPLLEKEKEKEKAPGKKTIVNISSVVGSIGSELPFLPGGEYATYAIAKASLNMLTTKQAKERPDITAISICPGHLQTDMGGPTASVPVSVGVRRVLKVVGALTPEDSGSFFDARGERVPW